MKNFYKVSNTIENGPRMDRQWSRISPINHRLWTVIAPMLLVAFGLFGVNEEMWGLDQYVIVEDFNNKTTFNSFSNDDISDNTYSKVANHVTFNINDVSLLTGMLSYGTQKANRAVESQFSWSAAPNYSVSVSAVSIDLKGYQAKLSWNLKSATGQFKDGTHTGTSVECKTNAISGGTSPVSISASPVYSPLTLRKVTGGNDAIYSMTSISFTYKVTHKEYLFGFSATTGVNNSNYGSATATVAASQIQAGIGETSASTTATFTATTSDGAVFVGWSTSEDGSTGYVSSATTYQPTINNTTAGHVENLTLYAIFAPVTVDKVSSNSNPTTKMLSITEPGEAGAKTATVVFDVTNADAKADFDTPSVVGTGWTLQSWSYASNKVTVEAKYTASATTAQGPHEATVTLTSKGTSDNQSKAATVYAYVDLKPTIEVNPTWYDFGMFTVDVDDAKSKAFTLTLNANAVTITTTDNASIAPFSASISGNTLTVYYEPTSVGTGAYTKTLRVTATNGQTPAISAYQDITLQGQAQSITYPQYTCSIANSYMVDHERIDLQSLWTSTSNGAIEYSIKSYTESGNNNGNGTDPVIEEGHYLTLGKAGTVELRLKQEAATSYYADSTFKTIVINKYATDIQGDATYHVMVDGSVAINNYLASNTSAAAPELGSENHDFYYTISHDVSGNSVRSTTHSDEAIAYAPSSHTISALNAGSATLTITQKETYKYTGAAASFNINVYKYNSVWGGVSDLETTVGNTTSSSYTLTYKKPQTSYTGDDNIAQSGTPGNGSGDYYYTLGHKVTTDTLTGCPEQYKTVAMTYAADTKISTGRNQGVDTVHLYQVETYKYNANSTSFLVRVEKKDNEIKNPYGSGEWSRTLNFEETQAVTLHSDNTHYDLAQIGITQEIGDSIGSYENGEVKAHQYIGYTTWSLHQDATYEYKSADANFTLMVNKVSPSDCDILLYSRDPDSTASQIGQIDLGGVGVTLTFNMKMNGFGSDLILSTSTNGSQWSEEHVTAVVTNYNDGAKSIPLTGGNIRYIKFGKGGVTGKSDPYVNHIRVTRTKYFQIRDEGGNNISTMHMPLNTPGVKTKEASFWLDYSTCETSIKLVSSNPRITFKATGTTEYTFSTGTQAANRHGHKEIVLVSESAMKADTIRSYVTAFTPSDNEKIEIIAETAGKLTTHLEYIGETSYAIDAANIPASSLFKVVDQNGDDVVGAEITLATNHPDTIGVVNDTYIDPRCGETATITASYAGDGTYEAAEDLGQAITITRKADKVVFVDGPKALVVGVEYDLSEWTVTATSNTDISFSAVLKNGANVSIEGNKLTATAAGKINLKAISEGNCEYNSGYDFYTDIIVRNSDDPCQSMIKSVAALVKCGKTAYTESDPAVYTIPNSKKGLPVSRMTGYAWRYYTAGDNAYIKLQDKDGNDIYTHTFSADDLPNPNSLSDYESIPTSLTTYNIDIDLSGVANNDKIEKIVMYGGGNVNKYFKDVTLWQEAYLNVDQNNIAISNIKACRDTAKTSVVVTCSDISAIQIDHTNSQFSYEIWKDDTKLNSFDNDCAGMSTYTLKFFYAPEEQGKQTDTVKLHAAGLQQKIVIDVTAIKPDRQVVWNRPAKDTVNIGDVVDLTAFAMTGCSDDAGTITYTYTSNSSEDGVATISALNNTITFNKSATVTVTAQVESSSAFNDLNEGKISKEWFVRPATYVFSGNGDWKEPTNWEVTPDVTNPDIIVTGTLVVDDTISVGGLTIDPTGGVIIVENGLLIVNESTPDQNSGYGDLHVAKDGELELNGELKVRHFTLDAKLAGKNNLDVKEAAASGQVENPLNLDVNGEAYFQMTFDPKGKISFGWYDFTVPFAVNINGGIERINSSSDKVMVCGTDFLIMEADEIDRANGGKGWRSLNGGTLVPGKLYTIGFDDDVEQNTFRFIWNGSGEIANGATYAAQCAAGSDESLRGWNGLGNGMLCHGYIATNYKMQAYDHVNNTYNLVNSTNTFAVGSAFFIQVEDYEDVSWTAAEATNERPLYAPKRAANEVEEFRLNLYKEEGKVVDVLYVSASEEATDAYRIGHDLLKMGTITDSKAARMWATKGGKKLCDVEATLVNDEAVTPLNLFAPNAGQYTLVVEETPEDGTLYLTYNGNVIWDLTASPYVLDLTKGTTTGYGLRIEAANAPQITTGVEDVQGDGAQVRKVIIDNKMYIITPEGAIFDAIGKKVQ